MLKIIIFVFINILAINCTLGASGYEYSLIEKPNQKIHMVKIDLKQYDISLVSAHNSVFAREKVGDIAERENAEIAINAGFFQIGGNEDGYPTGTLIIDGQIFGLRTTKHAVFIIKNNRPEIQVWHPKVKIKIGNTNVIPNAYNKFANNSSINLYSDKWGTSTLITFKNRKEVIISKQKKVTDIVLHGNNLIPSGGYVLSLPQKYDISLVKIGDSAEFKEENNYSLLDKSTSAIMGIPFLIMDGVINEKLSDSEKHARTAIGITENGKIIIVVVECMYTKTPGSLTLKEIQDILLKKKLSFSELKIDEAKKILFQELSHSNNAEGITLKELANFMLEQGCISAINLDGGGSSSLYIQGKYINNQIGDKDEASGLAVVRPVSDAIVFKKKP